MTDRNNATFDEIAHEAYLIWEREGRPEGKSEAHWFRAETLLNAKVQRADRTASPQSGSVTRVSGKSTVPAAKKSQRKTAPLSPRDTAAQESSRTPSSAAAKRTATKKTNKKSFANTKSKNARSTERKTNSRRRTKAHSSSKDYPGKSVTRSKNKPAKRKRA